MELENLLYEEIADELEDLKGMDVGSENYKTSVDGIGRLVDRLVAVKKLESESKENVERRELEMSKLNAEIKENVERRTLEMKKLDAEIKKNIEHHSIEMERLNAEIKENVERRKHEDDLTQKQMKEERIHRIVTYVLNGAGIIVPTVLAIWGTKKSFEFEKEGTITTIMGRGFINKLLPRK